MKPGLVAADGVTVEVVDPATCRTELDAANITEPGLRHDYTYSRALLDHHGRSYSLATTMLPRGKRPFVWALYGFARFADEFVDSLTHPNMEGLHKWATSFVTEACDLGVGDGPRELTDADFANADLDAVGRAMAHTMARWNLPVATVEAFLDSMLMDVTVTEYATYADLGQYMYGSAAVIGVQMAPVLGAHTQDATYRAALLGEAFQLTNFIRDVAEDSERGRVYVPVEVLARHGVSVADVHEAQRAGFTPEPLRNALRDMADHTEDVYAAAAPGVGMLDSSCRHGIQCAFRLYRQILHDIAAADFDVIGRGRVTVPTWRRARLAAPAVVGSWRNRLGGVPAPHPYDATPRGSWRVPDA